jgi:thioredoxin-related protein
MLTPRKLYVVLLALVAAGTAFGMMANMSEVTWRTMPQALEEAPKANKKILLDVYTDWCGWCKRMDKDTYSEASVAQYLGQHFIASKMNPEKEGEILYDGKKYTQREFGQALGINGYPATAVFNEKGELLTVIPGYIAAGEFIRILKYFGDDIYLKMKWDEYSKANTEG